MAWQVAHHAPGLAWPAPQVVAGLDEGLLTMSVGGLRRIYVPGSLAYPRGLPAGE